jgi:hypothetical protein
MPQRFSNLNPDNDNSFFKDKSEKKQGRFANLSEATTQSGRGRFSNLSDTNAQPLKKVEVDVDAFESIHDLLGTIDETKDIRRFGMKSPVTKMAEMNVQSRIKQAREKGELFRRPEDGADINADAYNLDLLNITEENSANLMKEQQRQVGLRKEKRQEELDKSLTFVQEMKESDIAQFIPIISSVVEVSDLLDVRKSAKFINEHKEPVREDFASDRDFILANKKYNENFDSLEDFKVKLIRKSEATKGGKIAGGIKALAPFIGEILLTKGAFTATKKGTETAIKAGLKQVVKKGVKEGIEEGVEKGVKKTFARKLGESAIKRGGTLAGIGVQTGLLPARSFATALNEATTIDEKGNVKVTDPKVFKGFADTYIELLSEVSGQKLLQAPSKALGQALAPLAKSKVGTAVIGKLDDAFSSWKLKNPNGNIQAFSKHLKEVGVNNVIEEIGEERFGGALRGLTGVNPEEKAGIASAIEGAIPNSFDEFLVELGVLAFPGGLSLTTSALNQAFKKGPKKSIPFGEKTPSAKSINVFNQELKKSAEEDLGLKIKTKYNKKTNAVDVEYVGITKDRIDEIKKEAKDKGVTIKELVEGRVEDKVAEPITPIDEGKKTPIDEGKKTPNVFTEGTPEFNLNQIDEALGETFNIGLDIDDSINKVVLEIDIDKDTITDIINNNKDTQDKMLEGDKDGNLVERVNNIEETNKFLEDINNVVNDPKNNIDVDTTLRDIIKEKLVEEDVTPFEKIEDVPDAEVTKVFDAILNREGEGTIFDEETDNTIFDLGAPFGFDFFQPDAANAMTPEQATESMLDVTPREAINNTQKDVATNVVMASVKRLTDNYHKIRKSLPSNIVETLDALAIQLNEGTINIDLVKTYVTDFSNMLSNATKQINKNVRDKKDAGKTDKEITDESIQEFKGQSQITDTEQEELDKKELQDKAMEQTIKELDIMFNEGDAGGINTDDVNKMFNDNLKRLTDLDNLLKSRKKVEDAIDAFKSEEGRDPTQDEIDKITSDLQIQAMSAAPPVVPPTVPPVAEGFAEPEDEGDADGQREEIREPSLETSPIPRTIFSPEINVSIADSEAESEQEIIDTLNNELLVNENLIDNFDTLESLAGEFDFERYFLQGLPGAEGGFAKDVYENGVDKVGETNINLRVLNTILSSSDFNFDTKLSDVINRYNTDPVFAQTIEFTIEQIGSGASNIEGIPNEFFQNQNFLDLFDVAIDPAKKFSDIAEPNLTMQDAYENVLQQGLTAYAQAQAIATMNNVGIRLGVKDFNKIIEKNFNNDKNIIDNLNDIVNNTARQLKKNAEGNEDIVNLVLSPDIKDGVNELARISSNFNNTADPSLLSLEQVKLFTDNEQLFKSAIGNVMRIISDDLLIVVGNKQYNKKQIKDFKDNIFLDGKDGGLFDKKDTLKRPFRFLTKKLKGLLSSKNIKPEYLARELSAYQFDNPVYQILGLGVQDGLNKSAAYEQLIYTTLKDGLQGLPLAEMSSIFGLFDKNKRTETVSLGGKNRQLTQMELLDIYMVLRQPDGRRHVVDRIDSKGNKTNKRGFAIQKSLFDKRDVEGDKSVANVFFTGGLSIEEVEGVFNAVDNNPNLVRVRDLFDSLNQETTTQLNETSLDLFGSKIAKVNQNYWHLETVQFGKDVGREIRTNSLNNIEGQKIFKMRTKSVKPLVVRDSLHRYVSLVKSNANYIGMAKPVRQIGTILNDESFRERLIDRGYENELDAYTNILTNATTTIRQSDITQLIQGANSIAATGILALNVPVVLLQNMSSMMYPTVVDKSAYHIGGKVPVIGTTTAQTVRSGKNLVQFAGIAFAPKELQGLQNLLTVNFKEAMEKSPIFWQRVVEGNVNPELTPKTKQTIKEVTAGKRTTASVLNSFIKKSDSIALLDGWALTKSEVKSVIKNGISSLTNPSAKQWYSAYESMGKSIPTEVDSQEYWDMVNARSQYIWSATQPSFNQFERTSNNSDKSPVKSLFFAFRSYWDTVASLFRDTMIRTKYDTVDFKQAGDNAVTARTKATWNQLRNFLTMYLGLAMASLLKDVVGNLVGRREKDELEMLFNMGLPFFNLTPIVGPIAQEVLGSTLKVKSLSPWTFDFGIPSLSYLTNIGRDAFKEVKAINEGETQTAEEIEDRLTGILNVFTRARGVDFRDLIGTREKLRDGSTSGTGRGTGRGRAVRPRRAARPRRAVRPRRAARPRR